MTARQSLASHQTAKPLRGAWEMVAILEERDIFIRMIKTQAPGYILYEDEVQVLAFPDDDMRRLLKR